MNATNTYLYAQKRGHGIEIGCGGSIGLYVVCQGVVFLPCIYLVYVAALNVIVYSKLLHHGCSHINIGHSMCTCHMYRDIVIGHDGSHKESA